VLPEQDKPEPEITTPGISTPTVLTYVYVSGHVVPPPIGIPVIPP
jgi:hypothetical protein